MNIENTRQAMRLALFALVCILTGCASTTKPGAVGVTRQQFLLIPAATVEKLATESHAAQTGKAEKAGKLITSGPEYERLLGVAKRVRAQVTVFREDTAAWEWTLALIDDPMLNASCAPGGKITFYTGIIRTLELTDDEIAAVMGHEIAHALREHGRERMSQGLASTVALQTVAGTRGEGPAALAALATKYLFQLPNSRENESEADKIGLELAARAGYDPHAAISLWQKMDAAEKNAPPEFLSTHPSGETRIADISAMIPTVMPLYAAAEKPPVRSQAAVTAATGSQPAPDKAQPTATRKSSGTARRLPLRRAAAQQ